MGNNTFNNNIAQFDVIKKFIQENIILAQELVDVKELEKWQKKANLLNDWINGDGLEQDPLEDNDWGSINVERPTPVRAETESNIEKAKVVEDSFEKDVKKQIGEFKSALLEDENQQVLGIQDFVDNAKPKLTENAELTEQLEELSKNAIKKRIEITNRLIERAATLEKTEARQLLLMAKTEWNPKDQDLEVLIQKKLNEIPQEVSRDTILIKLADIHQHEDQARFSGALYFLESLRYSYSFTKEQIEMIESERVWFDEKRRSDDIRRGMIMMGDLRQKYFEYERIIRKPETIYWYNDRSIKH
jgi:hypothetical protein